MYHFTAQKEPMAVLEKKTGGKDNNKRKQSFGTGKSATFPLQNFMNRSHKRSCRDTIRSNEPI